MRNQEKICIHKKTFPIAWGDMDALGHVNHARYFEYFQEARIEWLAEINLDLKQKTGPVVIQASCTFLKPVIYPATVTLYSYLNTLGRTSLILDHLLYQNEQLMAEGYGKIVWIDYTKNKPIPLPSIMTELLQKHQM